MNEWRRVCKPAPYKPLEAKAIQLRNSCPLKGQTMPLVHVSFVASRL
jgi:hypothetical protein